MPASAADPEDDLRAIVLTALDRYADDVGGRPDNEGAADSVLAALADEIPDGYDGLLRCLAERGPGSHPEPESVFVVSGEMAVELPGPADRVLDLMGALEQSVAAAKEARTRRPRPAPGRAVVRCPGCGRERWHGDGPCSACGAPGTIAP